MFSARAFHGDHYDEDYDEDEQPYAEEPEDFSDGYYDDPASYKEDAAQAWPGGAAGPTGSRLSRGRRRCGGRTYGRVQCRNSQPAPAGHS